MVITKFQKGMYKVVTFEKVVFILSINWTHRHIESMKKLIMNNLAARIEVNNYKGMKQCLRIESKLTRKLFRQKSETKSKHVLDLIHVIYVHHQLHITTYVFTSKK